MKKDLISKFTLFLIFFSGLTLYCGKKGPLKLDPESLPEKVTGFSVTQRGDNLVFKWSFPPYLTDGKTKFVNESIKKLYINYSNKEVPESKFKRRSKSLIKLKGKDLRSDDENFYIEIPFSYKKLDNKTYYFALHYVYKKKKSPLSDITVLKTFIPVKPVSDLKVTNERKVNKLSWSRPDFDMLNNPVESLNGYNIYRKLVSEDHEKNEDFKLLNTATIARGKYKDRDIGNDGEYYYYISTIYTSGVFSDDSNTVSVNVKDNFPPDIPENLTVFKGDGFLVLSWQNVSDKDLAFYRIFRKTENSARFSLMADKIEKNTYRDKDVKKGRKYYYVVTSVDKNGNESDDSNISHEEL